MFDITEKPRTEPVPVVSLFHTPGVHSISLWHATRLKAVAVIAEIVAEAETRIRNAHQRTVEAQRALAASQFTAARDVTRLAREADAEEAERSLWNSLRSGNLDSAKEQLEDEIAMERLLVERERLRRLRMAGQALTDSALPVGIGGEDPPMATHYATADIEALATRAVIRFGQLEPVLAERAWANWRSELKQRFPDYAAREIAQRADELRGIAGSGL